MNKINVYAERTVLYRIGVVLPNEAPPSADAPLPYCTGVVLSDEALVVDGLPVARDHGRDQGSR